ncbi:hypothetical protein K435DRAFT_867263 [Dendrothele bispora CBS 962.96]|uniref:Uncharacterized protein n=1 Tax=Dendrothele bispora (strain CBS 962.96) TaxID=1314807 RepID=A0A4S8LFI6_DENBC|nr:hypothetical protein K435DRAFT_867263 [Dendrothele bispora CBS 962.96]
MPGRPQLAVGGFNNTKRLGDSSGSPPSKVRLQWVSEDLRVRMLEDQVKELQKTIIDLEKHGDDSRKRFEIEVNDAYRKLDKEFNQQLEEAKRVQFATSLAELRNQMDGAIRDEIEGRVNEDITTARARLVQEMTIARAELVKETAEEKKKIRDDAELIRRLLWIDKEEAENTVQRLKSELEGMRHSSEPTVDLPLLKISELQVKLKEANDEISKLKSTNKSLERRLEKRPAGHTAGTTALLEVTAEKFLQDFLGKLQQVSQELVDSSLSRFVQDLYDRNPSLLQANSGLQNDPSHGVTYISDPSSTASTEIETEDQMGFLNRLQSSPTLGLDTASFQASVSSFALSGPGSQESEQGGSTSSVQGGLEVPSKKDVRELVDSWMKAVL